MSKIVVYLFCFAVITTQTSGQTNSDPAPGRSPGPPGMNTMQDEHGGNENADGATLLLTQDQSDDLKKVAEKVPVSKCENKLQSFLVQSSENESGKVVLLDESNVNVNEDINLQVEIIHEIFETNNGINCGLMYKSK